MSVSPTTDPTPTAGNGNGNADVTMRSPAAAPTPSPRSTHPTAATTTMTTTSTAPAAPSSHLASLLAEAYAETESLRRDLVHAQKRADRAERLAASLQALHDSFGAAAAVSNDDKQQQSLSPPTKTSQSPTQLPSTIKSPPPSSTNNNTKNTPSLSPPRPTPSAADILNHPALPAHAASLLLNALARVDAAEAQADEAHARSRAIADAWSQLDTFLGHVEARAIDARNGFSRVVREDGGVLTLPGEDIVGSMGALGAGGANGSAGGRSRRREHGWKTGSLMSLPLPPHPPLTHVHTHSHPGGSHSSNSLSNVLSTPTLTHPHVHSHSHSHSHTHAPHLTPNHTHASLGHANSYPLPAPPAPTRRPRTPSLDAYGALPPKKARGADRDRDRDRDRERERERGRDPGPRITDPHQIPAHHVHHTHQYQPPQPPQTQGEYFDSPQAATQGYPHPQQHAHSHGHSHGRTSSRRSESQSQAQGPPQSQSQSQSQTQPRMILPPRHHGAGYKQPGGYPGPGQFDEHRDRERGRRRARSGSHSSASSLSVDEMLLQATTGDEGPGGNAGVVGAPGRNGVPAPGPGVVGAGTGAGTGRLRRGEERESRSYDEGQGTPYQYNPPASSSSFRGSAPASKGQAQALNEPGQAREFQTHIFAPPVTGAPTKKNKFVNVNVPGDPPPAGTLSTATYPPTNESGQRICRQCGMAGRYKDGKCVEKWGPGPMGPGTVCDRCRKKMKRVERRGTLENQQLAHAALQQQQQQVPSPHPQRSHSAIHRSDTLPAHHHSTSSGQSHLGFMHPRETESNLRSSSTGFRGSPARHHTQSQAHHSPPPTIVTLRDDDIPTSAIGRGSEAAARANGRGRASPNGTLGVGTPGRQGKSPLGMLNGRGSRSPAVGMEVDADADADADAEADAEAEIEAEIEEVLDAGGEGAAVAGVGAGGAVGRKRVGGGTMDVDGEGEGDADADLLDAVDAAEANSSGSGGGRLKEEE